MTEALGVDPLAVWAVFALVALLARRDRRLLARFPLAGAVCVVVLALVIAAYRFWLRPGPVTWVDTAFVQFILALGGGFVLPWLFVTCRAFVVQDLARAGLLLRREFAWSAACVLLAGTATGAYFAYGTALQDRGAFDDYDRLFYSDPIRYVHIMEGTARNHEQVTHRHPLFASLGRGAFRIVATLTGDLRAPVAVSSAGGGLCLALAACYFRCICRSRALGLLLAALLGVTAGHLMFAAIPETYTLCAASLIGLHLLVALRSRPAVRLRHHVFAAALATGITLSSALVALVCFATSRIGRRPIVSLARWAACVMLLGCAALALQSAVIPAAAVRVEPHEYVAELRYQAKLRAPEGPRATTPAYVLRNLFRGLLLENVVGATPGRTEYDGRPVIFSGGYESALGRGAAGVWLFCLCGAGLVLARRRPKQGRTLRAASICLLISALIHSFFGNEHLFLFSCLYTFYVLAILAHAAAQLPRGIAIGVTLFLTLLLGCNNALFGRAVLITLEAIQVP